jgi:hypothetical protein
LVRLGSNLAQGVLLPRDLVAEGGDPLLGGLDLSLCCAKLFDSSGLSRLSRHQLSRRACRLRLSTRQDLACACQPLLSGGKGLLGPRDLGFGLAEGSGRLGELAARPLVLLDGRVDLLLRGRKIAARVLQGPLSGRLLPSDLVEGCRGRHHRQEGEQQGSGDRHDKQARSTTGHPCHRSLLSSPQ